jgi:hypothetical protein
MYTRFFASFTVALLLVTARADAQFRPAADIVAAEDFNVELAMMFWQPDPELTLTTGNVVVGTVDFVQEFGIADERFREFRVTLKPGRKHKIRFGYVPIKYDQDAVLQRTIFVDDVPFPAGANANADISWDVYKFGYEWDFVSMSRGFFGVVAEVKYNKVKADVTGTATALGQTANFAAGVEQNAPVPAIGVIGRGYLHQYVSITGEFTAFKYDNDEFRGKFYDFDIYGTAHLGKYVGAQVGYRSIDVDFLVDDDAGTMKMKGPYFGGFLRF